MNLFFIALLKAARNFIFLIPKSETRKLLRTIIPKKITHLTLERQARFSIKKGNTVVFKRPPAAKIHVFGRGNNIFIDSGESPLPLEISITGNNNSVEIQKNCHIENLISLEIIADGATIKIGEGTMLNSGKFYTAENNSRIIIGSRCLFSWNVDIWCTDGHSIVIPETHERTNKGEFVEIGDHVWIGKNVQIGKNVKIPAGCIIGWHSVLTKSFSEENCIIAGVPAQIIKRNRTWDISMPCEFDRIHGKLTV